MIMRCISSVWYNYKRVSSFEYADTLDKAYKLKIIRARKSSHVLVKIPVNANPMKKPLVSILLPVRNACKAHHLKHGFLKGVSEVTLAGAGLEGRAWYRTLLREGVRVVRWIDVDPHKVGRTLHGAPVVGAGEVKAVNGDRMLVTVGTRGSRDQVRRWASEAGFVEGNDFICVT
jgi:FlaA1/EpsC-like NDP-sugar epimerase